MCLKNSSRANVLKNIITVTRILNKTSFPFLNNQYTTLCKKHNSKNLFSLKDELCRDKHSSLAWSNGNFYGWSKLISILLLYACTDVHLTLCVVSCIENTRENKLLFLLPHRSIIRLSCFSWATVAHPGLLSSQRRATFWTTRF